jgi:PilZ domain-containing protein
MPPLADREKRRGLRLALNVSGRDARGAPFAESAETVNISGGGVCFLATRALPVGARLDLRIQVPAALRHHFSGRAVYAVKGVVCRLEHLEGAATYKVGVRFLGELEA